MVRSGRGRFGPGLRLTTGGALACAGGSWRDDRPDLHPWPERYTRRPTGPWSTPEAGRPAPFHPRRRSTGGRALSAEGSVRCPPWNRMALPHAHQAPCVPSARQVTAPDGLRPSPVLPAHLRAAGPCDFPRIAGEAGLQEPGAEPPPAGRWRARGHRPAGRTLTRHRDQAPGGEGRRRFRPPKSHHRRGARRGVSLDGKGQSLPRHSIVIGEKS